MSEKVSVYFPDFKKDLPDCSGKVFCITGTTSGTGFVAAQTVAEKGGTVVCLNRASPRVQDSTAKLKAAVPDGDFVNIVCDLQDFESVRKAAGEIKKKFGNSPNGIYCLSCNAGISHSQDKATVDGCDVQMQTNHLSHFLLTAELYPLLLKSAETCGDARIVYHSSIARLMTQHGKLEQQYLEKNGGNLGGDGKSIFFGGGRSYRYAQSKLANSIMTHAMHSKLQAAGGAASKIKVCASHPGGSQTALGDNIDVAWFEAVFIFPILTRFFFQSAEDGTMGLLTGMLAPDAESGVLYGPTRSSGMSGPAVPNPPKEYEHDPEAMTMLWETSEATTGVKFNV